MMGMKEEEGIQWYEKRRGKSVSRSVVWTEVEMKNRKIRDRVMGSIIHRREGDKEEAGVLRLRIT